MNTPNTGSLENIIPDPFPVPKRPTEVVDGITIQMHNVPAQPDPSIAVDKAITNLAERVRKGGK